MTPRLPLITTRAATASIPRDVIGRDTDTVGASATFFGAFVVLPFFQTFGRGDGGYLSWGEWPAQGAGGFGHLGFGAGSLPYGRVFDSVGRYAMAGHNVFQRV